MVGLEEILKRLEFLERKVGVSGGEKTEADEAHEFERLPATATVGMGYVAYRFGCTKEAVRRGRAGTHRLTPYRVTPKRLRWIKQDVDRVWSERSKSKTDKALTEISNAAVSKRRRSIIRI